MRWGGQAGSIFLAVQKLPIRVPRVRNRAAEEEVALATYKALQMPRAQDAGLFSRVLGGISCREYEAAAEAVPEAFGLGKSSVSRRFIRASARQLRRLQEQRLDDAGWLVLVVDGKTFAGDQLVVAVGVTTTGEKRILGVVQTATENKRAIGSFLRELVERGFHGAADDHPSYADAKHALQRLGRELRTLNESAAASLEEGLEETLTLHRLGVFPELGRSFATTNLIESVMARIEEKTARVDRWRTSDQKLRWCAAALGRVQSQFRRVKGYRQLTLLKHALAANIKTTTDTAA